MRCGSDGVSLSTLASYAKIIHIPLLLLTDEIEWMCQLNQ